MGREVRWEEPITLELSKHRLQLMLSTGVSITPPSWSGICKVCDAGCLTDPPKPLATKAMRSKNLESIHGPLLEALATAFLKCSEKSSLSEKVTPNVFNEVTRGSPGTGGGIHGSTGDKRGLFTINSQDFERLSLRLLVEAHEDMESQLVEVLERWFFFVSIVFRLA